MRRYSATSLEVITGLGAAGSWRFISSSVWPLRPSRAWAFNFAANVRNRSARNVPRMALNAPNLLNEDRRFRSFLPGAEGTLGHSAPPGEAEACLLQAHRRQKEPGAAARRAIPNWVFSQCIHHRRGVGYFS